MLLSLLAALAIAYLALIALLAVGQNRLIYPAPPAQAPPAGYSPIELHTADGLTLVAGYRPARRGLPTVLFFHGNAMAWPDGAYVLEPLAARGYGVLLAEYRGYNGNPGRPSEEGLYHDARAARAWLESEGVASDRVVLMGLSVGSGPAVQLASEAPPRALILVSPLASLPAAAAAAYPWLPITWFIRDKFDNIAKLPAVDAPVLVVHGEADGLIPLAHAKQLADVRPGTQLVTLPGRGHNMAAEPEVLRAQLEFLARLDDPAPR